MVSLVFQPRCPCQGRAVNLPEASAYQPFSPPKNDTLWISLVMLNRAMENRIQWAMRLQHAIATIGENQ